MELQLASTYQPESDEVWVDLRALADDLQTPVVIDSAVLELSVQSTDLNGTKSTSVLSTVATTSDYAQADKNFVVHFRHPRRRADLILSATANIGDTVLTKQVSVGEAPSSDYEMALPNNVQYTRDALRDDLIDTTGNVPNENSVILAQEIQSYVNEFDFTSTQDEFSDINYSGGGNRLLLQKETNQFVLQTVDTPPWEIDSYVFLEPAGSNLIPNAFFTTTDNTTPTGYAVDAAGSVLWSTVVTDYTTTSDAKIWKMRFQQTNILSAFGEVSASLVTPVSVTAGDVLSFSAYVRVLFLSTVTKVKKLILSMKWYTGSTFLSESTQEYTPANLQDLQVVGLTATVPPGANAVRLSIKMNSVEAGDDVELQVLAPQLEAGSTLTTRMNGSRQSDLLTVPDYQQQNQKIRIQLIPGFNSGSGNRALTTGPLELSFTEEGTFSANLVGQGVVTASVSFTAGELLDLTVSHQSGKTLSIMKDGVQLNSVALGEFTSAPEDLVFQGVGAELLRLYVFNRS